MLPAMIRKLKLIQEIESELESRGLTLILPADKSLGSLTIEELKNVLEAFKAMPAS